MQILELKILLQQTHLIHLKIFYLKYGYRMDAIFYFIDLNTYFFIQSHASSLIVTIIKRSDIKDVKNLCIDF